MQIDFFHQHFSFLPKTAKEPNIKTKGTTIAFFISPPHFFLLMHSCYLSFFFFLLFFCFANMTFGPIGCQKPAFWPFSIEMDAHFARFV